MCSFLQHETIYPPLHSERLKWVRLSLLVNVGKNTNSSSDIDCVYTILSNCYKYSLLLNTEMYS